MSKPLQALLLSLGLAISLNATAGKTGMYRWHDEAGTVQYSDRPPEGVESEFVEIYGGSPHSEKKKAQQAADKAADGKDKSSEPDKMEVMQEKDPELCKQAQNNLRALDAPRIRITESDGSQHYLTDEERETQKANARKVIEDNC